jgi:RNA polymerase alpha subunit
VKPRDKTGAIPDPEIAKLAVGHLCLGPRARRAALPYRNIGCLYTAWANSSKSFVTPTVARELEGVFDSLLTSTGRHGVAGWDVFRRSRPLPKDIAGRFSIYFMSPRLGWLKRIASNQHLAQLHLSNRSINALEAIGIATVGELVRAAHVGLSHFSRAGDLTATEIRAALEALSATTARTGEVDWVRYARARGFIILPGSSRALYSARRFLDEFASVVRAAVRLQYGPRGAEILESQYLAPKAHRVGLRKLGKEFGRTHQLVSLMETKFITMLRRAIWLEDYRGCRFRLQPQFLRPLREMAGRMEREGIRAFSRRQWNRFFTYQNCKFTLRSAVLDKLPTVSETQQQDHLLAFRWDNLLRELWGVTRTELGNLERLLLQILGFQLEIRVETVRSLLLHQNKKSAALNSCAREFLRILRVDYPSGASADFLYAQLKKKFHGDIPSFEHCLELLKSQPTLEYVSKGIYRLRTTCLVRVGDRLERLLRDEGKILHHREIAARESAFLKQRSECSARQIMSYDHRFVPLGRSGFWGLAEWGLGTGSIADVAANEMRGRNRAFTEAEIFNLVRAKRPCARGSIGASLVVDARFLRVKPVTWELVNKHCGVSPVSKK